MLFVQYYKGILQFVRFGIVGIINTAIALLFIYILFTTLHLPYIISNVLGYIAGLTTSLFLNKIWTFRTKCSLKREAIKFIITFIFCYLIQLVILVILVEYLDVRMELAQIISIIFYTILNFLGNKFFTFDRR